MAKLQRLTAACQLAQSPDSLRPARVEDGVQVERDRLVRDDILRRERVRPGDARLQRTSRDASLNLRDAPKIRVGVNCAPHDSAAHRI